MITIDDQETFMHSIHDVLNVGININNLAYRICHLKEKYQQQKISDILNSQMKDEKYSDELVYPIIKIIYTRPSHINHQLEEHYQNKLSALELLEKNGANMKLVCGEIPERLASISKYAPLFLDRVKENNDNDNDIRLIDLYYSNGLIDDKIRDYLRQFDKMVIEI
jgi:hypothetical protein